LAIGDDTGNDEIRLEYIVNGAVSSTVITSSGSVTNAITDIGFLVRVTRSNSGAWELFTSSLPTTTGTGAIATTVPDSTNATISQGTATHNTLVPADNGYIGVAALHSTGAGAIVAAEFDQVYFTTAGGGGTATKLAVTSISPTSPTAGSGFNVTVQSQDGSSVASNVTLSTGFTLSNTGGGTIGGSTTGTITAGTSSIVVTGVTLSSADTGVTLTATRTSGDALTAGTSAPFNVLAAADHIAFVGVPSTGAVNGNLATFTVEARRPDNSVDTTYTGNVVITKATGSGSLSGTTTKAAVAGVATFNDLQFNAADTYTLNANSSTFTQITSGNIVVTDTTIASDFFRSLTSGNLATPATWESSHDGTTGWITATLAPDSTANTITIRTGHTVTVAASVSLDQTTVDSGGQITINSGQTLTVANGTGVDWSINGTALNTGTLTIGASATWAVGTGGTFIHNAISGIATPLASATLDAGSSFIYRGSSTLNVTPSVSGRTYGSLSFESTSGAYTPSSSVGGGTCTIAGSFSVGAVGAGSVSYSTVGFTGPFNVAGGVTIGAGSGLTLGSSVISLNGNLSNSGSFTAGTSTVAFNGSSQQQYSRTGTGGFNNLTLNNTTGLLLNNDASVGSTLILTSGVITTGANTLTLASGATVSGGSSASYVAGTLKKSAVPASFIFPVGVNAVAGHAAGYTPLDLANAIGGGDLTVTTNHVVQTVLDTSKSLNEYWTLASAGTLTADLTFHYLDTDVNGNEADYQAVVVESGNATHFPADIEHSVDTATNVFTVTGVSSFSDWTVAEPAAPTAVKLTGFRAVKNNGEVMLQWQSGYEARNLGYQIYREQDGKRVAITPSLVAGSALVAGRQTKLGAGLSYTWYDQDQKESVKGNAPAVYWLEDIDLNGTRTLHGPIVPEISYEKPRGRELRADLIGEVSRRSTSNGVQINGWASGAAHSEKGSNGAAMFADPSDIQHDLAGMPGVKLAVSSAGWYRVSQTELAAAGFTVQDARQLQLYRNGREVALSLSNGGNSFTTTDYLEFYGEGLDSPTSAVQTYYLVNGRGNGARINSANGNATPAEPSGPQSFDYTVERKERMIYFSGLRNGDGENFFGQIVSSDPVSASMPVSNLAGTQAELEIVLQGVTNESHLVEVVFNGAHLGTLNFANTDHPATKFTVPAAALHEGDNAIELTSMGGASDVSLIDVLRLTYNRSLVATDNALSFSVNSRDSRRISGFTNPNVRVLDISDTSAPFELKASVSPDAGAYAVLVDAKQASALNPRTLLAIAGGQARQVDAVRANVPSALWTKKTGADYVLITTAELLPAFEPLAQLRRNQGMAVALVDVEDVYDEFSFGKHSPEALRDFLQRAVKSWKRQPHFVLFAGDASYDPKNYLGQGLNDLLPTKLVDTALTETASDDWLADFNRDGIADLAIGRLPVRTLGEASQLVAKIINYENSAVDPTRNALLVADTSFEGTSSAMKNVMPAGQPVQLINRSATDDLTAHSQIIAGLNQGPRLANYFGHGSNGIWSGAGLLSSTDAPSLTNTSRLSVFTMMTCFNGYFHDAYNESLSEALLKSQGGAVAVWASTGLTEPKGQNVIGEEFYRLLFGTPQITLGDAARMSKAFTNDADVRRTWTLFGDPATRLR
jgi:hypothetical protein